MHSSVLTRQICRIRTQPICQAKPPHQYNRRQYPLSLPAPTRGGQFAGEAQRSPRGSLQAPADLDVLHQWNVGEATNLLEGITMDKDALVAGGDTAEA